MEYVNLGHTSLKVSRIAFGCMSLGTNEDSAIPLIHEAIESGVNYFDTADLYDKGVNEQILGKALKNKRTDIIVATKVGNHLRSDGSGWDWNPTKKYILQAVEQSLARLQTDYIDLYQLHGGTIDDPIDETIEAFEILKQQGKIRYYGISSIRPNVIVEYVRKSAISSVMMQYSLLDRRPEEKVMNLLQEKGISVLARGALSQGLLAGKPARPYLGHDTAVVNEAAVAIELISNSSRSPVQSALCFALQNSAVASVVAGIRINEQVKEIIDTVNVPPITAADLQLLREKIPALTYSDHR